MKLYKVPRDSRIRLASGLELNFSHIDGAYSFCRDDEGNIIHISASAEVEVVNDKANTEQD